MGHRYFGTADTRYRDLVHTIDKNSGLSECKKDELFLQVDLLVGHMIPDFDSSLRDQYTGYYCGGSRWLKNKHWFSDSKEMLMEVALKALESCTWARKRFNAAGYTERI